jgi:hypothetical protein
MKIITAELLSSLNPVLFTLRFQLILYLLDNGLEQVSQNFLFPIFFSHYFTQVVEEDSSLPLVKFFATMLKAEHKDAKLWANQLSDDLWADFQRIEDSHQV